MKRLDLADRDVGLAFVIGDDNLDGEAAELVAHRLHRERKAVAQLLADDGCRARQRGNDADLQWFIGLGDGRAQARAQAEGGRDNNGGL